MTVFRVLLIMVLLGVVPGFAQPNVTPRGVATLGVQKTSDGCKQTVMVPDPTYSSGLLAVVLAWESERPDVVSLQTMVRYEKALLGFAPTLIFDAPDYVARVLADPGVYQRLIMGGVSRQYPFQSTGYVARQEQEFFEVSLPLADAVTFLNSTSVASVLAAGNQYAEFTYTEPFITELALGFGAQCLDAVAGASQEEKVPSSDANPLAAEAGEGFVLGDASACGRDGVNRGGGGDATTGVAYSIVVAADCTLRLLAVTGGTTYVLDSTPEPYYLLFADLVDDFDGDGLDDVLYSYSMGGNCCPAFRTIASVYRDGTVQKVDLPYGMWLEPEYEDGVFHGDIGDSLVSFRYDGGRITDLEEVAKVVLQAVVEVTLDDVIANGFKDVEVNLDIDGDGVLEVLSCGGFRALGCAVNRADGTRIAGFPYMCHRFGQLPNRTNGYSDFVCNQNIVMTWDGSEYRAADD